MFKKKPVPKEETKVTKVAEVAKGPECIRCGSTKLYAKQPNRLGCRVCGDSWDVEDAA